jgi:peptide/nickel transport system permease protein
LGLGRFVATRTLNLVLVLFAVLFLTIALAGPATDNVLKRGVGVYVKQEIAATCGKQNPPAFCRDANVIQEQVRTMTAREIENLGLNEPWWAPKRLWYSLYSLATLNLGEAYFLRSYSGSSIVRDIIVEAIPKTVLLFTTSAILSLIIGLFIGIRAARKPGGILDRLTSTIGVASGVVPIWWVGIIMIIVFSYGFRIFPARATPLLAPDDPQYIPALLYHMTLPLITITMLGFGGWAYIVRNLVIGIMQEDYITVAMAKGVPERNILYGHVLRSAAPPVVTIVVLSLSGSLGGALITEAVFDWPGMGRLIFNAIGALDIPIILGATYVSTALYLTSIFIADVLYGFFDPRVKAG